MNSCAASRPRTSASISPSPIQGSISSVWSCSMSSGLKVPALELSLNEGLRSGRGGGQLWALHEEADDIL